MAYVTHGSSAPKTPAFSVAHAWNTISGVFATMVDTCEKVRHFEALSALSDAELSDRGLKRQDLARFVFLTAI